MNAPDYDVVVIGSGPAGCAVAINCRNLGLSVLVITDRPENEAIDPYSPSESIHPGISGLLKHLGASSILEKASLGNYPGIETGEATHLFDNDGHKDWQGTHVHKSMFNKELIQLLMAKQGTVLFDEVVSGFIKLNAAIVGVRTGSGKEIIAKYTIDASGRNKLAGKTLEIKESFFSPPLVAWSGRVTDLPGDHLVFKNNLAKFIPANSGWTWLAPENSSSCTFTCLSVKGKQTFAVPKELENAGTFRHLIKFNMRWCMHNTVAMEGLLLCGDAAAILDPAAGQGILNAVYSGIKASETIAHCIENPEQEAEFLDRYSRWFRDEYNKKTERLKTYYAEHHISTL